MSPSAKCFVFAVLLLPLADCTASEPLPLTDKQIDEELFALRVLPKTHYYWPGAAKLLEDRNSCRLYELVRITHSFCVSGEWTNQKQIDNGVYTCTRLNKTEPAIKASIGANFSPWHRKFDKSLPPTDRGKTYWDEIRYFENRANLIKGWMAESNAKYGGNIQITAVMLDCERFGIKRGNKTWNEGIRQALDAIHLKAKEHFPDAVIIWYGRGMIQNPRTNTWRKTYYWTGQEIKAPLTCSLYNVPELDRTRAVFRKTVELADEMGVSEVIPYVALASGYRRNFTGHKWLFDWRYDVEQSYQIGAELNIEKYSREPEEYAPYDRAKYVVFYPRPFDKRAPDWGRHFIAYVKGATAVKE